MTATDIILIIGALGLLIAPLGAVIVNIIQAARREIATVGAKADVIAGHVNSAASASVAKIDALTTQVETLTATVSDQKQAAALLTQALAMGRGEKP